MVAGRRSPAAVVLVVALIGTLTVTPASAATALPCNIVTGADTSAQQIARLYKAVFRRAPEPSGWNYWKGVSYDATLFEIADHFVAAPEFRNLYGAADNDEFVRLVYQNVMGRNPDLQGHSYWLGLLNRGAIDRSGLVVYFSESAEFKRRETERYFERCAVVVHRQPSVMTATFWSFYDYVDGGGRNGVPSAGIRSVGVLDGRDLGTAYAGTIEDEENVRYLGDRRLGEPCVASNDVTAAQMESVTTQSGVSPGTVLDKSLTDRQGNWARPAIDRFRTAVDAAQPATAQSCDGESAAMLRLASPFYSVLSDVPAVETRVLPDGYVYRRIELGTDWVRTVLDSGDRSLLDFYPDAKSDLAIVDNWNREHESRGIRPSSSLSIEFKLIEDPTGNLAGLETSGYMWLRHEGNALYMTSIGAAALRVPASP